VYFSRHFISRRITDLAKRLREQSEVHDTESEISTHLQTIQ
jgi:hypothetical protein